MADQPREIDTDDLAALDGAQVVDVREPSEYVEGHVPGARLVPMGQLPSRLDELDRDRPVYVVCGSGNRSGAMVPVLESAGFETFNVVGGTKAWVSGGHPVNTGQDA